MKAFLIVSLVTLLVFSGCLGQTCPKTFEPVCGSDNTTYLNSCQAALANAEIKSKGPCGTPLCSDSDGGKDLFDKGTATDARRSLSDACEDSLQVREAYCTGDSATDEIFPCPRGYACSDGRCVKAPCQDSDNGKDPTVKGAVTAQGVSYKDACAGANSVKEYYCAEDAVASEDMACGAGRQCVDGACIESACTDSDGGKNATIAGSVVKGSDTYTDSCIGGGAVKEYYCDGKTVKNETISCQSGYSCSEGRCARDVCIDSDGGKDASKKGNTTYGSKTNTDSCYSNSQVLEYFCSSDTSIDFEKISCGTGRECNDGRCRAVECVENVTDLNATDERYSIATFDNADTLVLYAGESVEVGNGYILKLQTVSGNNTTLRLYENITGLRDSDQICSVSIANGSSKSSICSKSSGKVEVLAINASEDTAELSIAKYYAAEYYSVEGTNSVWTDNPICPDSETVYDLFSAEFYPYLDTNSSRLNLDGKRFRLFDALATIREVTDTSITFELDGEEFTVENGDRFQYLGQDYRATLDFNDGGLFLFEAKPS